MSKARKFADASRISDALTLPAGDTASRPADAVAGSQRYNTDTGSIEFYDGANWISTNLIPEVDSVTGTIYAGAASNLVLVVSNATDIITVKFAESGTTIADVEDVTVSSGSFTVAVPSAVYGQTAGDTITVSVINQDGTPSSNGINKTVQALPTGGTITTSGSTRTHVFTSSGSSTFTVPSGFTASANILLVGGGGGGSGAFAGGGGAGGVVVAQNHSITANSYSIVVGAGGTGGIGWQNNYSMYGTDGSDTTAFGWTASGGGGGSEFSGGSYGTSQAFVTYKRPGGCGGGGASAHPDMVCWEGGASDQQSFANTTTYGTAGGNGNPTANSNSVYLGGGGGGAGQSGRNYNDGTRPGGGGNGIDLSSIFGTSVGVSGVFAGGGGAGNQNTAGSYGAGGAGGGTAGTNSTTKALDAAANTGSGAGGGGYSGGSSDQMGGNGGSGIVVVSYQLS